MKYCIYDGDDRIEFVLDAAASKGIVRVAEKVAADFERVTGIRPEIRRVESIIGLESEKDADHKSIILFDINEGSFAQQYASNSEGISGTVKALSGRRECFAFAETGDNLVIAGSDRLGTIYGMFELSKMMGVSPLIYWADAAVEKKERVELDIALPFVSKEPSVKFRGYFINDEWPCFGNWTTDHFGGFTAEMYDHVFEFLLRIIKHAAIDACRRNNRLKRKADFCELTKEMEECLPGEGGMDLKMGAQELGESITDFLRSYPEEQCSIFLRRYWYYDTVPEISRRFGCTQGKVKSILFRMREALKKRLEREGYTP